MKKNTVQINGLSVNIYSMNTVIVGSGCAGFNAADCLHSLGQEDIAVVTEGVKMGTSRNTGSDKQTYYKLTMAGGAQDSVLEMAGTLFAGGSRHGDIALVEAALSARCFNKLVEIGVPFPFNRYGEYAGYKTDHDPRQRATSAGPLTSKYMTEKLESQVRRKGIQIFDGYLVIGILTDIKDGESCAAGHAALVTDGLAEPCVAGLIALDTNRLAEPDMGLTLFNCTNIVYATGGPAGIYFASVYPESQTGASGIAFEAGAGGINLTESQFGIASTKFRWNLSGTYQQVIPRYLSTDRDGNNEKEFLNEYFDRPGRMLDAIFLKGYQWPFDPRKISGWGSSLIDILVYNEIHINGRRVFLDFMHNPGWSGKDGDLDFSLLGAEAFEYLKKSDAVFGVPIGRLKKMNGPAVDLYRKNGIDLEKEYLEIDVCAQHNNGGLVGNIWWESNLRHFFPVGEANGSFGVYRPGGSALNSTQAGSLRAAQYISAMYREEPPCVELFVKQVKEQVYGKINLAKTLAGRVCGKSNLAKIINAIRLRMTRSGAHIRNLPDVERALDECKSDLINFEGELLYISSISELPDAFRIRDMLLTQFLYLCAIREYIRKGGRSRGSYIIRDSSGDLPVQGLPDVFRFTLDSGGLMDQVCEIALKIKDGEYICTPEWKPVRPVPETDNWFESVWNDFMKGNVIR